MHDGAEDLTLEENLVLAIVQFSHERGKAYEIYKYPFDDDSGKYVLLCAVKEPSEPPRNRLKLLFEYTVHISDKELASPRASARVEDRRIYNDFLVFLKSYAGIDLEGG